ncbi:MAG: polysaccharide deacetylase family protein [Agathobacter sp.]|nr:polysaccharide deacetylase family protein [Agathobacter sp.]
MSTKDAQLLEEQRERRARINKMKTGIIMSIAIWMLVSFIAIISLAIAVIHLNSRVYKMELNLQSYNTTSSSDSTSKESQVSDDSSSGSNLDYSKVVSGIDNEDNMAVEGDTHNVYLTFDCIPSENTNAILDALAASGVKATFFVSGDETGEYADVYKRIVDEGHTIAMHSYSNQFSLIYSSIDSFENDLKQIQSFISTTTGKNCKLYRFPGGSSNEISNLNMAEFVRVLNNNEITYFDWNVSAGDTSSDYTVDDIVSNVITGIEQYKNSVVLLHDDTNKSTTAEAIGPLVDALKNKNAEILPIDEDTYVVQYIKAYSVE